MPSSELPPISNKALYACRVFTKWFSFFFFGFTSLLLSILILPPMRLLLHPKERFKKYARRFISASFRFFIGLMHVIGTATMKTTDRHLFRNLSSKVIVANHPSLLDVVMLISLIPNADCIVNAYLSHSIVTVIIHQLYIVSSMNYQEIMDACFESLKQGNCLIIFPEGTRTPRSGKIIPKKGAARIALESGCGIVPVHIGGNDKYGLGKKDPWTAHNHKERYIYLISMGEEISPDKYSSLPKPAAAKALTNEFSSFLFPGENYSSN